MEPTEQTNVPPENHSPDEPNPRPWEKPPLQTEASVGPTGVGDQGVIDRVCGVANGASILAEGVDLAGSAAGALGEVVGSAAEVISSGAEAAGTLLEGAGGCFEGCASCSLVLLLALVLTTGTALAVFH